MTSKRFQIAQTLPAMFSLSFLAVYQYYRGACEMRRSFDGLWSSQLSAPRLDHELEVFISLIKTELPSSFFYREHRSFPEMVR